MNRIIAAFRAYIQKLREPLTDDEAEDAQAW